MDRSSAIVKMSETLYTIFKDKVDSYDYDLMFNDNYIKKEMKKIVGKKLMDEFDCLERNSWIEAWQGFDELVKQNRKEGIEE